MTIQKILTRNFILAFLGQFAFTSVFHIFTPTLPIYLSRIGSTDVEIGILMGTLSISSLPLRPFVGRALLRIPERNFMILGALLFTLTSAAYLVAPPFWPFLVVRVLQGIGLACFYTASVTLIANISPEAHRGQSLSYFYLSFNLSFALAPSFGIFLINVFNFKLLFIFCAGISLSSLLIAQKLRRRQEYSAKESSIQDGSFISRKALPPAIITFFNHLVWGALTAFFPLYALNHGMANPGFFFAIYAIILILGRSLGGKLLDRYKRENVILPCLIASIISMTVLTFSKTVPMFFLVAIIWGIGNAFLVPSVVAYTLDRAGHSRGPAMGTYTAFQDLGIGLGPVIMGIILRLTSYPMMFLSLALTGVISLCYFYFFLVRKNV